VSTASLKDETRCTELTTAENILLSGHNPFGIKLNFFFFPKLKTSRYVTVTVMSMSSSMSKGSATF